METRNNQRVLEQFETRDGETAVLRNMEANDVDKLHVFINKLSAEDTFITYSGEEISKEEEQEYVESALNTMNDGDAVYVVCENNDEIIGNASIARKDIKKERSRHVGVLAISVDADYRDVGIGKKLLKTVLEQSKQNIEGLKMVELEVFGNNRRAIELYRNVGFAEVGRIPNEILYRDKYTDGVHMALSIEPGFLESRQ
jgi:ribosomal protein S18 acetylase RimI-like enzyme